MQQLDQRARLTDVLEVGGDHRVERLLDEPLDVAEPLDDERRLAIVDVHHHGQGQRGLEGVLRDQRDFGQVLVVLVRAGLLLVPLQNEIGRGHQEDLPGVGVERVFPGQERFAPDATQPLLHQLAVLVRGAGEILARLAGVGGRDDRLDHPVRDLRGDDALDLELRQQADVRLRAAVGLRVALLAPAALHLGDVEARDADLVERVLNRLEPLVADDRLDLADIHYAAPPPLRVRGCRGLPQDALTRTNIIGSPLSPRGRRALVVARGVRPAARAGGTRNRAPA